MADRRQVERYIADAQQLDEDFRGLIHDAELEQQGWTIRYATDFSEIFAHVDPDWDADPLRIFRDDPPDLTAAVQRYVLHKLFYGLSHDVILLPHHADELRSYVNNLRTRGIEQTLALVPNALQEAKSVLASPEFSAVEELLYELLHGASPDPEALEAVLEFFQENAAYVVRLIDGPDTGPLQRLTELLERERLEPLGSLVPVRLDPAPDVQHEWSDALNAARPEPDRALANWRDSMSVGFVAAANRWARGQGLQFALRLVTRSRHMLAIDRRQQISSGINASLLRHSRAFIALTWTEGSPTDSAAPRLKRMQMSLRLMIDAHESRRRNLRTDVQWAGSDDAGSEHSVALDRMLEDIRHQLYQGTHLASVAASVRSLPHLIAGNDDGDRPRIIHLFEMIRDERSLLTAIERHIGELASNVDRNQQLLSLLLQGTPEFVGPNIDSHSEGDRTILGAPVYWMPYKLEFNDAHLREWTSKLAKHQPFELIDILRHFQSGLAVGLDHEMLLSLAYLFGVLDRWDLALQYCDLALMESRLSVQAPAHQGMFFKAVCLRMLPYDARETTLAPVDRYLNALDLLEAASEMKMRVDARRDPRYLAEMAAVLLRWSRHEWAGTDAESVDAAVALEHRAIAVSDEAFRLAEHDHAMPAWICNNLCFHYLQTDDASRQSDIRTNLHRLERMIRGLPMDSLPATFVDTVLYAYCRLRNEPKDLQYLLGLRNALRRALDNPGSGAIRPADRRMFERHVTEADIALFQAEPGSGRR